MRPGETGLFPAACCPAAAGGEKAEESAGLVIVLVRSEKRGPRDVILTTSRARGDLRLKTYLQICILSKRRAAVCRREPCNRALGGADQRRLGPLARVAKDKIPDHGQDAGAGPAGGIGCRLAPGICEF